MVMVLEIIECVYVVSKKIYATVDEVQANRKRCQRLSERIRCLVTPLNELLSHGNSGTIYKEALIDLVSTLEESRQFLSTFTKEKTLFKKLQDACYANKVKETFEHLNDRLNILVPALTFGLQVENRKSVRKAFSSSVRLPEDVKDESKDLRDMQQLLTSLGLPSFHTIRHSDLREMTFHSESQMYSLYRAKYRMNPVIVKKPNFDFTNERKEYFLNDAKNMLQFNSENVVRVFGVCLDGLNSYLIVQEFMELGNLHEVLHSSRNIEKLVLLRMCVESSRGLYFVHCSDVIHRNVSSSKFLVNIDLHVKISGFKFSTTESTLADRLQSPQFCCSFADNLLPNDGSSYSERNDVFRYGYVLCEIVTCSSSNHHQENNTKLCRKKCISILQNLDGWGNAAMTAVSCLEINELLRPTMEEVVQRLTSEQEQLQNQFDS